MADNLNHVILCLQNIQWLSYEIPNLFSLHAPKPHSPCDQYVVSSLVQNVLKCKIKEKKNLNKKC